MMDKPQGRGLAALRSSTAMPHDPNMGGGMDAEREQASPQEQAIYEKAVLEAVKLTHAGKSQQAFLQALGEGNPMDAVALATAQSVGRVAVAAAKAGRPIPPDVLMPAAGEVMEAVMEMAEATGKIEFTPEDQMGVAAKAFDELRVVLERNGLINRQQAQQDLSAFQQADQSGELARMIGMKGGANV